MEEVVIPLGMMLRFRCNVESCQCSHSSSRKSFSIITIFEHLASHYSNSRRSSAPFRYRCQICGSRFYFLGMTVSCVCTQKNLKQEIVHKDDLSSSVVQHDVGFFAYVKRHAVPVLVKVDKFNGSYERSRFLRQESSELSEKTVQVCDLYLIRSPSMYADGTPRAPLSDDDEEMEPAYSRALRNVNWNSEGIVPRNNAVGNLDRGSISSNDCVEATNSHILTNKSNSTNITEQRCERMKETEMQCSFNTLQTQEYSRRPWSDAIAGNKRSSPIPGSHDVQMTSRNNLEKNDDSCRRLLRPQPPPIPQGSKPKVSNGDRAPRASSVRSYQRKSRQDGLLEENPSPPRIRRQMCSTPLLRPESTSRSGPFVPRSESTATQCGTRAVGNGLQKSSCHSSSPRLTTKLSSPADMECRLGTRPSFIQNIPSVSQMPNGSQYGANPFIIAPYLPPGLMQVPPHFSPLQYPGIFCNNTLIPPFIDSQTGGQFFGAFNNRQDFPQQMEPSSSSVNLMATSPMISPNRDNSTKDKPFASASRLPRSSSSSTSITSASKPPERIGGSKFLDAVPPILSSDEPAVDKRRRKRRSSRHRHSESD